MRNKINAMKSTLCYLMIYLTLISCKSSDQKSDDLPMCIAQKIENLKKEPIQNPPAEVWKWEANSKTFYYFISPCCDQFNNLYSEACEKVCAPDGGFTGRGDQKCPDFDTNLKKSLVWKDDRKDTGKKI